MKYPLYERDGPVGPGSVVMITNLEPEAGVPFSLIGSTFMVDEVDGGALLGEPVYFGKSKHPDWEDTVNILPSEGILI